MNCLIILLAFFTIANAQYPDGDFDINPRVIRQSGYGSQIQPEKQMQIPYNNKPVSLPNYGGAEDFSSNFGSEFKGENFNQGLKPQEQFQSNYGNQQNFKPNIKPVQEYPHYQQRRPQYQQQQQQHRQPNNYGPIMFGSSGSGGNSGYGQQYPSQQYPIGNSNGNQKPIQSFDKPVDSYSNQPINNGGGYAPTPPNIKAPVSSGGY